MFCESRWGSWFVLLPPPPSAVTAVPTLFPPRGSLLPGTVATDSRGCRDKNTTSVKSLILEIEALICADVSAATV